MSAKTLCEGSGTKMSQRVPKLHGDGFIAGCPTCQRSLVPKADGTSRPHSIKGKNTRSSDDLNSHIHQLSLLRITRYGQMADLITQGWLAACHAYNTILWSGVRQHLKLISSGASQVRSNTVSPP